MRLVIRNKQQQTEADFLTQDGSDAFLRNVGETLRDYTSSRPRRSLPSSSALKNESVVSSETLIMISYITVENSQIVRINRQQMAGDTGLRSIYLDRSIENV